jgi:predicted RNA binding protein with dsRBD fold (UPF0201 family)
MNAQSIQEILDNTFRQNVEDSYRDNLTKSVKLRKTILFLQKQLVFCEGTEDILSNVLKEFDQYIQDHNLTIDKSEPCKEELECCDIQAFLHPPQNPLNQRNNP